MRLEAAFEDSLGADSDPQSETGIEHLARILSHMPQLRRQVPEQAARDHHRHERRISPE